MEAGGASVERRTSEHGLGEDAIGGVAAAPEGEIA